MKTPHSASLRHGFLLTSLMLLATSSVQAQDLSVSDLVGWWRSDLAYNGQKAEIYIRFTEKDGKARVHFTLPPIQGWDFAAGGATLTGNELKFEAIPLLLNFDRQAGTLSGDLPKDFAPAQKIPVAFRKDPGPQLPKFQEWSFAKPAIAWTYQADGAVWAGLSHDAPRRQIIVATDKGSVVALNTVDGTVRWQASTQGKVRARPVIAADSVYVNSDDGNLYKLDAKTGTERWRAPIDTRPSPRAARAGFDRYGSAALVKDQAVFVGSVDGNLYALDAKTGRQLWRTTSKERVYASPIAAGDAIVFGSFDGMLYSVAAKDGSARWQHDTRGAIATAPIVAANRIIVGNRAFELTGHDPGTGAQVWKHYLFLSWVDSEPSAVGGTVYVGSSDTSSVMAFDAASGKPVWSSMLGGWCWAQPAVSGDRIYAGVSGGPTPVGPRRGALVALDRKTGAIVWAHEVEREGDNWGFPASPVAVGDRVFAADVTGKVYSFGSASRKDG